MYFLNDIGGNTALSPSLSLLVLFSPTFVNDKITVVCIRETASKRYNVFLFPIDRHSLSLSPSLRYETRLFSCGIFSTYAMTAFRGNFIGIFCAVLESIGLEIAKGQRVRV